MKRFLINLGNALGLISDRRKKSIDAVYYQHMMHEILDEVIDITNKEHTSLKESLSLLHREALLYLFINQPHSLNCIVNDKGEFVLVSKSWKSVLGYDSEELIGSKFIDYIHPDDVSNTIELFKDKSKEIVFTSFRNRYKCKYYLPGAFKENGRYYKWLEWMPQTNVELAHNYQLGSAKPLEVFDGRLVNSETQNNVTSYTNGNHKTKEYLSQGS